jgi:NAD(P)-dependent dehydrogenase (short-subunit alcohol dehydrogenase family)
MDQAPTRRLEGRSAIVTGASRGIGLAIAQRLVQEGARVCLTARRPDPLAEAVAELPAGSAITVAGKADDAGHRDETIRRAVDAFGGLDVLVLNAGINPAYGPISGIDVDVARKILEVNVLAPLAWTQSALALAPGFATSGAVVTVSSVTGRTPAPGIGMYGVSKAALAHLTRTMAVELGPGVRVNAVSPAVVKTQFAKALYEGKEAEVEAGYPLKRLGRPEDVAAAVAYLASDDAAWVTGEVLTVDGGLAVAGGTA